MLDCADDDTLRGSWLFVVIVRHSIYTFDSRLFTIVVRSLAAHWRRGRNAPLGTYFFGVIVEHVMSRIRGWPSKICSCFSCCNARQLCHFTKQFFEVANEFFRGPPSMIYFILLSHPNDAKQSSARTRDSMTYTSSHLTWASIRLGIAQWAQSPGSAVVP